MGNPLKLEIFYRFCFVNEDFHQKTQQDNYQLEAKTKSTTNGGFQWENNLEKIVKIYLFSIAKKDGFMLNLKDSKQVHKLRPSGPPGLSTRIQR